uniref:Ground-like domain-containing protein n=1 Tax=Strongyloides stercoralis TaxID=6248 RepID=A0A0K0DZA3_STRER
MFCIIIIGIFLSQFSLIHPYGGCNPFFSGYNPMFLPIRRNLVPCDNMRSPMISQSSMDNMLPNLPPCTNCNPLPQVYQENFPQTQVSPSYYPSPPLPSKPIPISVISQGQIQPNPPIYRTIYSNTYPTQLPSTSSFLSNCKDCFEKLSMIKYLQHSNVPEGDQINEQHNILTKPPKIITEYATTMDNENKNPFKPSLKQGLIEQETYDRASFSNDKEKEKVECNFYPNTTYYSPPMATSSYPTNECCVDCEEKCQYYTGNSNISNTKKSKKVKRLLGSSSFNTDGKCTSKQLKNILSRYIGSDAKSSVKIIQKVGDETMLEAHNVICSEGKFYYITRSSSFCQLTIGNVHCYIFKVIP